MFKKLKKIFFEKKICWNWLEINEKKIFLRKFFLNLKTILKTIFFKKNFFFFFNSKF